jgi:hypothetical protein
VHAAAGRSNKRMQLTKLRAAPVLQAEVPPCAPAGGMDGGTASQLIRSVRQTQGASLGGTRVAAQPYDRPSEATAIRQTGILCWRPRA